MRLDAKDQALLALLEHDAKAPVQSLAERTGMPPSTVHHRLRRLEQRGVILGYGARLDPQLTGRGFSAYIMVTGAPEKYLDEEFFTQPEVAEVSAVTGSYDLVIKVRCSSLATFNAFLQDFRERYGQFLTQTVTMVCTEVLKG